MNPILIKHAFALALLTTCQQSEDYKCTQSEIFKEVAFEAFLINYGFDTVDIYNLNIEKYSTHYDGEEDIQDDDISNIQPYLTYAWRMYGPFTEYYYTTPKYSDIENWGKNRIFCKLQFDLLCKVENKLNDAIKLLRKKEWLDDLNYIEIEKNKYTLLNSLFNYPTTLANKRLVLKELYETLTPEQYYSGWIPELPNIKED
jgi:hypothetical protein